MICAESAIKKMDGCDVDNSWANAELRERGIIVLQSFSDFLEFVEGLQVDHGRPTL